MMGKSGGRLFMRDFNDIVQMFARFDEMRERCVMTTLLKMRTNYASELVFLA